MYDGRKKSLPKQHNSVAVKRTRDRLIAQLKALCVIGTYQDNNYKGWETLLLRGIYLGTPRMVQVRVLNGEVHLETGPNTYEIIPIRRNLAGREQVGFMLTVIKGQASVSWPQYKANVLQALQDAETARLAEAARVSEVMRQGNQRLQEAMVGAGYTPLSPEVLVHSNSEGLAPNLTLVGPWTPDQVQEILMAVRKIRDHG